MDLATTRRTLHAVAELVLAGPQYRSHGDIRLRVTSGGFATVTGPEVRVDGGDLATGDGRWPIDGHSCADLATAAGLVPRGLEDVYADVTDVRPDEILALDPAAAAWLARCWTAGDAALRRLVPAQTPVLWPEHFDVGVRAEDTNYGVSPGDGFIDEPYAYVTPPQPRRDPFWNQPFGAAKPMRELGDARPDAVLAFFAEGRDRLSAA